MSQKSWDAGNHDPCNSEFNTDSVDKICEAVKQNDVSEILENIEYPVVICHSPNDDMVYFTNVPDATMNDNLILIQDVQPVGSVVNPQGGHIESNFQCLMGFIFPFIAPPEDGDIRKIIPVDICSSTGGDGSGVPTKSPAAAVPGTGTTAPTKSPTEAPTTNSAASSLGLNVFVALATVSLSLVMSAGL